MSSWSVRDGLRTQGCVKPWTRCRQDSWSWWTRWQSRRARCWAGSVWRGPWCSWPLREARTPSSCRPYLSGWRIAGCCASTRDRCTRWSLPRGCLNHASLRRHGSGRGTPRGECAWCSRGARSWWSSHRRQRSPQRWSLRRHIRFWCDARCRSGRGSQSAHPWSRCGIRSHRSG